MAEFSAMTALGLVVLRIALATTLVIHGAHQLFGTFAGPGIGPGGLAATAVYYNALGLAPGAPLAVLAGVIQFLGGLLLAIGFLTRPAAVAVIACLAITLWKDQLRWGFFLNWTLDQTRGQGVEYSFVLIGALACLLLAGAGDLSLDGRRAKSAASRASARARMRTRT